MSRARRHPEGVRSIWLDTLYSRLLGYGVHVYRAGPWLIDAGFHHARRRLLSWSGLGGARACLLTHHHEDHVGAAAPLSRRGIPVRAPAPVLRELERLQPIRLYRRLVWGRSRVGPVEPLGEGPAAADGWRLVPLHTPGHATDHFVYHEPDRGLIFSADLYLGGRVPVAKPDEDLGALLASLRRVRDLEPRAMFCAHRGRIERPREALAQKIDWIERLIEDAKRLADRAWPAARIARRLLGREGLVRWASQGEYSKRNLVELALRV